jgi:hypothetical protein
MLPWLETAINSCPSAGNGVHFWIFRVARQLHAHLSEEQICALLKTKVAGCGRPVPERELLSQIRSARSFAWRPNYPKAFPHALGLPSLAGPLPPPPPAWPKPDLELIRQIVSGGEGLCDLIERSPVRFDDGRSHAEEIIDTLFPGNPLLCVGRSRSLFATRRRENWRGHLHRLPLIVPNPMLSIFGYTKVDKHLSEHTLDGTARRVYLVKEFDFSAFARDGVTPSIWAPLVREWQEAGISIADACAALHLHLSRQLPLIAAVYSGGKSIHGWYYVFRTPEAQLRPVFEYAVKLGADDATWTRSQFVRIPDGRRETGKRQITYFFDPNSAIKL